MSLLQSIEGMLMPEVVERIGTKFGIGDNAVRGGVGSLTKDIVGGLSTKTHDAHAMGSLSDLINEAPEERPDVDRALDDETSPMRRRGSKLLSLATDDQAGLASRFGRSTGLSGGAATGMLGIVGMLVMGGLRKFGAGRHLDAGSLGNVLRTETGSFDKPKAVVTDNARAPVYERDATRRPAEVGARHRRNGLWWLLALIPLIVIAIWAGNRGHQRVNARAVEARQAVPTVPTRPTTPHAVAPSDQAPNAQAPNAQAPNAQTPNAQAPNAQAMTFAAGSGEQALLTNLRSSTPSNAWITLDSVRFDNGSAALDPGSTTQLAHVAEILQAHPQVHLKIGGYTDATGAPEANMQLSQARAEGVKQALVADGIDPSRLDTEAFGPTRPVEPTAGASETNRRVAIQVTAR